MKKSIFIVLVFFASAGFVSAQQQKSSTALEITKADLLSFKDIKPLLSAANRGADYSKYIVQSFKLMGTASETGSEGVVSTSFVEPAACGTWTVKQRSMIEQYAKKGMVFTVAEITMIEPGQPGTPYVAEKEVVFSVPNISFTVKE